MQFYLAISSIIIQAGALKHLQTTYRGNFRQPAQIAAVDGWLNTSITIEPVEISIDDVVTFRSRVLNGQFPGQTLRIRAGDSFNIVYQNKLHHEAGVNDVMNEFRLPDDSNLHFHGMVISPSRPCDDVRHWVGPGHNITYSCQILGDHMPGIHWLHPHKHGATSIQLGMGAASAIIVDEPEDYLSRQLEKAPERIFIVQHIQPDVALEVARVSGDRFTEFTYNRSYIGTDQFIRDSATGFFFVNGVPRPRIAVEAGTWERWRILNAGWKKMPLDMHVPGCRMVLLSKDGIFISDFPREISLARIPVGGRADVMVCCGRPGEYIVHGAVAELADVFAVAIPSDVDASHVNESQLRNDDVDDISFTCPALEPWQPPGPRPRHLRDLRNVEASKGCACATYVGKCPNDTDPPSLNCKKGINGVRLSLDADTPAHQTYNGAVTERHLYGMHGHHYHGHVFPFQLVGHSENPYAEVGGRGDIESKQANESSVVDNYYKIGDWHDSYHDQFCADDAHLVVRLAPQVFHGEIAIHCHQTQHEDKGMMMFEKHLAHGDACKCMPGYEVTPYVSMAQQEKEFKVLKQKERVERDKQQHHESENTSVAAPAAKLDDDEVVDDGEEVGREADTGFSTEQNQYIAATVLLFSMLLMWFVVQGGASRFDCNNCFGSSEEYSRMVSTSREFSSGSESAGYQTDRRS